MKAEERRTQFRAGEAAVRAVLNEWAPIGVDAPEDEYDCLVHRILGVLHRRGSILDVKTTIQKELSDHFGLSDVSVEEIEQTATKIWKWWSEQEAK